MNFVSGNLYHVYNQGNNRQNIFIADEDYLIFLRLIRKLISPQAELFGYCLMPNHFHLILQTDERIGNLIKQGGLTIDPLTNAIRKLLSGYARIFNKTYNRSGSLFRQKTKTKLLNCPLIQHDPVNPDDYVISCFNYIHENPVKAGLVKKSEDWIYSSCRDFAGMRNGSLCNKKLAASYGLTVSV